MYSLDARIAARRNLRYRMGQASGLAQGITQRMWALQQWIQFAAERYQQAEVQVEKNAEQLPGYASYTMPLRAAFSGLGDQQRKTGLWGNLSDLFGRFTDWLEQADIPEKLKQYEQEQLAELQRQKYEIPGIDYNLMDEHTKARVREALDREWERKQAAEAFAREAEAMYQAGMERRQSIMENPKHFPAFKEHYEKEAQHYISLIENLLPKDSDAYKWYYGYAYLIANSQDELSGMYNERRVNELLALVEGIGGGAISSSILGPQKSIPEPKMPGFNIKGNSAKDFEKSLVKLSPAERVATVRSKAQEVANNAGLVKDSKLSKINGRDVYKDPKTGDLYSVDTQHGRFEKSNSQGKHLGEVDFDFKSTKPADTSGSHNLKVN
jgi:hypothetical protein